MRWLTAGESHGQALVAILRCGGRRADTSDVASRLARRRLGFGRAHEWPSREDDVGCSVGSAMVGRSAARWRSGSATRSGPSGPRSCPPIPSMTRPPPVSPPPHVTHLSRDRGPATPISPECRIGFDEARPILERASARETAARVALGAVARPLRQVAGVEILSHVVALGSSCCRAARRHHGPTTLPVSTRTRPGAWTRTAAAMVTEVETAQKEGDTLGGVVEVVVHHLPVGLGSHVHGDRKLDARLAGALMGIQAIKGVQVGDGFELARTRVSRSGRDRDDRRADRAGPRPVRRDPGRHVHRRTPSGPGGHEADLDRASGTANG